MNWKDPENIGHLVYDAERECWIVQDDDGKEVWELKKGDLLQVRIQTITKSVPNEWVKVIVAFDSPIWPGWYFVDVKRDFQYPLHPKSGYRHEVGLDRMEREPGPIC